ncbi:MULTISPECIES: PNGase F N-terminal domain-containing protein [unclassified Lentimicrobium]|uniref:PNGase F N-terminal domain-containing protein n=1 Tax=unclassified Lentimicrobium TaxID=2677434 RepID=UPI0015522949|nr:MULTISPECIES: PNGase F N-terminal domain-containing protein [unclassified Lentimicrobium]NPD45389.1 peptide-N-glycosidase [Lentimicrobium sp. S6]NPD85243.1 peptide-N-glycosidase [Lentimicrobium sp. L6]
MRSILIAIIVFGFSNLLWAQNYEVKYQRLNNNKLDSTYSYSFKYMDGVAYLSSEGSENKAYIDFNRKVNVDIMTYDEVLYKTVIPFAEIAAPEKMEKAEKILGYKCKKAIFKAFSNTIEVWFTEDAQAKGSPYKSYLPANALALKIVINGSREIRATEIIELDESLELPYPFKEAKEISEAKARELQIRARYTNFPVFDHQQINFEGDIENPPHGQSDVVYRLSNGTVILKKIKVPEIAKQGASVFATITNWSNGDAYDRTGSLFLITQDKEMSMLNALEDSLEVLPVFMDNMDNHYQGIISNEQYDTPVELMRFFTSFGVSHFNHIREIENYLWQDSVVYKQEITSVFPNDEDEVWIGVFIGNYDGGGHYVSLNLQFYPPWSEGEVAEKYIQPLFNTVNIMEMSGQNYGKLFGNDTLEMEFDLPENIENLEMLFTTTGHGGWGGGDEFNPKLNQVFIDGELVFSHIPWRTDCGTYRMSNPASGNFENGLSSSDLSRSNWCPATLTPPYFINLYELKPGKHKVEVVIEQGENEGSSFSSWCVSGVLVGEKTK